MKTKLLALVLFIFTLSIYGQEFIKGSIITTHYDTITNVNIKKVSNAKSLLHLTYIDINGNEQKPDISSIKYYERGDENFCRIYNSGEMILVKSITKGKKLNLYERDYNGNTTFYIEKVYDELIKVPSRNSKFKKTLSAFLSESPQVSEKIKSNQLLDIKEIVNLYNKV